MLLDDGAIRFHVATISDDAGSDCHGMHRAKIEDAKFRAGENGPIRRMVEARKRVALGQGWRNHKCSTEVSSRVGGWQSGGTQMVSMDIVCWWIVVE